MSAKVSAFDWARTPLGPMAGWPTSLRTAVGICLNSRLRMFVWWGPELINIYNDAYIPVLGNRHPAALGKPAREVWGDLWPEIRDDVDGVMRNGTPVFKERVRFPLNRHGYPEETYFTYSYSPIPDDNSGVGGLFQVCYEVNTYPSADGGISIYFRDVTERKRDEEALRESTALLQGVSDSTGDVIFAKDRDGKMRFANPAALNLIGKPLDQVIGKTDLEFLDDKEAAAAVMENDRAVMESGNATDFEESIPLSDGTQRVWYSRKVPNRDSQGNIIGLLGISRDITEKKGNTDRIRRLYEVASRLSEAVTPEDVARVVVHQGLEAVGASAGSLVLLCSDGENLEMVEWLNFTEDAVKQWKRMPLSAPVPIAQAVRLGQAVYLTSPRERLSQFPALVSLTALKGTRSSACLPLTIAGRAVGALGLSFDFPRDFAADEREFLSSLASQCAQALERARLFERERTSRAEAELAEAKARDVAEKFEAQSRLFERIASSTPDFIYIFDLQGRFLYANRRLLEVWGTTADQALGKNVYELGYPKWHADMHMAEIRQVIETKQPIKGEVPFTGGSGISGTFEYIFTPVLDPSGEVEVIAGTTRDVTERKQLLASEQAARTDAEHASKMKDEFLATLSHELRTPLNAILGWATILLAIPSEEGELREGLKIIERNARAQTQIIEDLLDMSRIISGKVRLEVQRIDLVPVVQAAVDTIRPAAEAKGVRLRTLLGSHAGPVSGDASRLQQVFWNLLTNAVKFTPRGGQIEVLLERVNSNIEVIVADTGEGIAAEFLPQVFDRFRQADASTTRRHGGLGLGLAIVKQLVELHGGTVRVKSPGLGRGSTFVVFLPLTIVNADPEKDGSNGRHAAAVSGESEECERLSSVRVLVVDDEADARNLVKRLLEDCEAIVRVAGSAEEALKMIQAERPDVLVSDIGMPGTDGYGLIRQLRSLDPASGGDIPAVALTAYARTGDRVRAIRAGFQSHVAKPVEPVELIAVIASLAGQKQS